MKKLFFVCSVLLFAAGCVSNSAVSGADKSDLSKEGTITFSRPVQYTWRFGSRSQKDMFEIVYQNFSRNEAGQPVMQAGIRYRGPVSWTNWFMRAPAAITINGQCNFYRGMGGQHSGSPVIYSTNNRALTIRLGETFNYTAVCPVKEAQSCQLVLSEKLQ